MRVIKIDVLKKQIYEVDISGDYKSMCAQLDSDGYEKVRLSKTEVVWVDGDGLLREPPLGAFEIYPYPNALSGHGLIIGLQGPESVSTRLTIDEVRQAVRFVEISELPVPVLKMSTLSDVEFAEYIKKNRS